MAVRAEDIVRNSEVSAPREGWTARHAWGNRWLGDGRTRSDG